MNFKTPLWRLLTAVAMLTILAGCSAAATPAPTTPTPVTPTADTQATFAVVQTQAVATAEAQMTLNAPTATPVTPTSTPAPTDTPTPAGTPTQTATPTHVFIPWTKTPTAAPADYNCTVTAVKKSVSPVTVGINFDTVWSLKNSGIKTWNSADLDVKYSSGDKLQSKGDLYDLPHDVAPNGTVDITVDMKAPANDGTYTTAWVINFPDGNNCNLTVSVDVSK